MALTLPVLYSTGTELSYRINQRYYKKHFVWCTSNFDSDLQPGTSNPRVLCMRYLEQIVKNDSHAYEIVNNKAGILKGANANLAAGIIDQAQYDQIKGLVDLAEPNAFYPVVYIIHKAAAKKRAEIVNKRDSASAYSEEFIISDLLDSEFDLIRVKDMVYNILPKDNR